MPGAMLEDALGRFSEHSVLIRHVLVPKRLLLGTLNDGVPSVNEFSIVDFWYPWGTLQI